jgi:hypothetical protein
LSQCQTGSDPSVQKLPQAQNRGVAYVLSKQHQREFSGERVWIGLCFQRPLAKALPTPQPGIGFIFLPSEFPRAIQDFAGNFALAAICR